MPPTTPQDRKRKTKKAAEDRYAPTSWGSTTSLFEDLTVPSGQTCLVRRPGVQGLIEAGVLNSLDSLTAIVDEKHIRRVNGEAEIDVNSLANDSGSILNVLHVVDKVVCYVVVKPEVVMPPDDPDERSDDAVYVDMVDIEDKMFLFNFAVGGTRSLESFREERDQLVGSVEHVEAVAGDAK